MEQGWWNSGTDMTKEWNNDGGTIIPEQWKRDDGTLEQ